jgi:hypothetical protein
MSEFLLDEKMIDRIANWNNGQQNLIKGHSLKFDQKRRRSVEVERRG